jgi:hypothetical protein
MMAKSFSTRSFIRDYPDRRNARPTRLENAETVSAFCILPSSFQLGQFRNLKPAPAGVLSV